MLAVGFSSDYGILIGQLQRKVPGRRPDPVDFLPEYSDRSLGVRLAAGQRESIKQESGVPVVQPWSNRFAVLPIAIETNTFQTGQKGSGSLASSRLQHGINPQRSLSGNSSIPNASRKLVIGSIDDDRALHAECEVGFTLIERDAGLLEGM